MASSIYFIKPHMNYMKEPAEKKRLIAGYT